MGAFPQQTETEMSLVALKTWEYLSIFGSLITSFFNTFILLTET